VQRNIKMPRPTSIMGPSTPLVQRSSITAPVPVDVSLFTSYLQINENILEINEK
jgi:hypothetical protein